MTEKDSKKKALKRTTQTNLWLRIFVGGFIIYMMTDVVKGLGDVSKQDFIILLSLSVLLILASVCIIIWSIYKLVKKEYYDPLKDDSDETELIKNDNEKDE